MISHTYRCIFIHQRKCAGSSIISAFGLTPQDPEWHSYNNGAGTEDWRKRTRDERSYFVFSAVRNPFDRIISGWQYLDDLKNLSLREALEHPPRKGHDYRHFTRPQSRILKNRRGKLVTDDLIRFESCQQDFDRVCDQIGMPRRKLPRFKINRTRDRDYRRYFDEHTRALATEMFREDLETFGYEF